MEEEAWESPDHTAVPMVNHAENEYILVDIIEDDYLSLLSSDGVEKNDVKLPKGALGETIRKLFFDNGKDMIVTVKNGEIIDEVINYKL